MEKSLLENEVKSEKFIILHGIGMHAERDLSNIIKRKLEEYKLGKANNSTLLSLWGYGYKADPKNINTYLENNGMNEIYLVMYKISTKNNIKGKNIAKEYINQSGRKLQIPEHIEVEYDTIVRAFNIKEYLELKETIKIDLSNYEFISMDKNKKYKSSEVTSSMKRNSTGILKLRTKNIEGTNSGNLKEIVFVAKLKFPFSLELVGNRKNNDV